MNRNFSLFALKLKIVRIDKTLPLPEYHTPGSVAFDIYSRIDFKIAPGQNVLLPTNLIIEVPEGFFLMITGRSSVFKQGLLTAFGVIDQDYHGPQDELKLNVKNLAQNPIEIKKGQRLAQGLILPIEKVGWEEVEQIKADSRGGFGSTG